MSLFTFYVLFRCDNVSSFLYKYMDMDMDMALMLGSDNLGPLDFCGKSIRHYSAMGGPISITYGRLCKITYRRCGRNRNQK